MYLSVCNTDNSIISFYSMWFIIQIRGAELGDVLLSLRYSAGDERLEVTVKELKGIRPLPGKTTASKNYLWTVSMPCANIVIFFAYREQQRMYPVRTLRSKCPLSPSYLLAVLFLSFYSNDFTGWSCYSLADSEMFSQVCPIGFLQRGSCSIGSSRRLWSKTACILYHTASSHLVKLRVMDRIAYEAHADDNSRFLSLMMHFCSPLPDTFVRLYLVRSTKQLADARTKTAKKNLEPRFNQTFVFNVSEDLIDEVNLIVRVKIVPLIGPNKLVGEVCVGCHSSGQALHHWQLMIQKGVQIDMWHQLEILNIVPGETNLKTDMGPRETWNLSEESSSSSDDDDDDEGLFGLSVPGMPNLLSSESTEASGAPKPKKKVHLWKQIGHMTYFVSLFCWMRSLWTSDPAAVVLSNSVKFPHGWESKSVDHH